MIEDRKNQHIDIVLGEQSEHRGGTLLECVDLVHQSLPELDLDDVQVGTRFLGRQIDAPLLITGMTGGSDRAADINKQLAEAAQRAGVALGVGSMRPMIQDSARRSDYDLRGIAPDIPLLGNLGVMQAAELPVDEARAFLAELGYDALCLHLNPAQELAQPEGDRRFRGALETITRYQADLGLPVIVKETGAGLSPGALAAISAASVSWVDVSGSGGTSWTRVEANRPDADDFGHEFADWGIPTAVSLVCAHRTGLRAVSSGGIRSIHDIVVSLVLGARIVGAARPVLVRLDQDGPQGAVDLIGQWQSSLRKSMLLLGVASLEELRHVPRIVHPPLSTWLQQVST